MFLDKKPSQLDNTKDLLFYLHIRKFDLDEPIIRFNRIKLREFYYRQIGVVLIAGDEIEYDHEGIKKKASFGRGLECQEEWPICVFDNNFKNRIVTDIVFRTNRQLKIVEDYFFNPEDKFVNCRNSSDFNDYEHREESDTFEPTKSPVFKDKADFDNILIERRKHLCKQKLERLNTYDFDAILRDSGRTGSSSSKFTDRDTIMKTLEEQSRSVISVL